MINGGREVGPNAVLALKREGYKNTDFSLLDTLDSLTYKGFINFLIQNFSFAMGEFFSSISTASFVAKAKKLIPEVEEHMFVKGGTAGVRAQALSTEGELLMDFNILREGNQVHVLNAPSPGATASLSIAKHIIENYIK
jgi:L-2-hydroxyglutarate oxidase